MNSFDSSYERSAKRVNRIKWSALIGLMTSACIAFVSIFSAPITINYLGKEMYGIWAIISSFLLWVQLFDLGILNGLTNALSEAFGRDDYTSVQSHISTTFLTTALISGFGIIIWIVGSLYIPWSHFIKVNNIEQSELLRKGICIVGCFFLISFPFQTYQRILHANQRLYIYHGVNLIAYLLTLFVLILGVYNRFSLLELLFATSATPFICHVFSWSILTKKVNWAKISWKYVQFSSLKRIASSSIPILALQIINIITSQIIPIMLTYFTSLKVIADFSILWKIYLFLVFMMANISSAHNPGFREAFERCEIEWIKKSLKRLAAWQTCLVLTGCLPLLIAGNQIVETWIRMPLEQPLGFLGWCVYTFCILFSVLNNTLSGILTILDKIYIQIIFSCMASVILIIGIMNVLSKFGLVIVFAIVGLTCFLSVFGSFLKLKKTLNNREKALFS